MELLEIADVAERLGLPVNVVRFYRDRFILYVPCLRLGRRLRYPPEAMEALADIHRAVAAGVPPEEIERALQERFPVTVLTSQPVEAGPREEAEQPLSALRAELDALGARMTRLITVDDFHGLRAETATLTATLLDHEARREQATVALAASLQEELARLRQEFAAILLGVQEERARWKALAGLFVQQGGGPSESTDRAAGDLPGADQLGGRPMRRLGQPLRPATPPQP